MLELLRSKPFLVAILAGMTAQAIKVISFLIIEKKVNYKRFVQTGGSPNMHSATMAALSAYIGLVDGFYSVVFALSLCFTVMVAIDTWNVKGAHLRHQEFLFLILDRLSDKRGGFTRSKKALSYTPIDVFSGAALGVVIALLVL